jgi:hypothetical protein
MKKAGPTIESFLDKIQQQMGVAIVGIAAYRDNEGKLCTFEYVISPTSTLLTRANPYIASALRMRGGTPSSKHTPRMLKNSWESGENGLHKRVMSSGFYSFYLLTCYIYFRSWEYQAK